MNNNYLGKPMGLRNLTWFDIIKDDEDGVVYGDPVRVARAIEVTLAPEYFSDQINSDDSVEDDINLTTAMNVTISSSQLSDKVRAQLMGHKQDEFGGVSFNRTDTPQEGALAFRSVLYDKESATDQYLYMVLYKGSFREFEEKFETIRKDGVTVQTHTGLQGTFIPRHADGQILYRLREDQSVGAESKIENWFSTPQEAGE